MKVCQIRVCVNACFLIILFRHTKSLAFYEDANFLLVVLGHLLRLIENIERNNKS